LFLNVASALLDTGLTNRRTAILLTGEGLIYCAVRRRTALRCPQRRRSNPDTTQARLPRALLHLQIIFVVERIGMSKRAATRAVIDPVTRFLAKLPKLRGKRILLALSGGADSVALLHALAAVRRKFHFELAAAHLNHGLRAAESDRDEAFVRGLCASMRIELIVERSHGLQKTRGNLEARARAARHRFLSATAERIGADYIALAHQADDQAETVMLRLLRGAGVAGLGAMAESGAGKIIRPLLQVRRSAILDYVGAIGATFVEDSTNASLKHDRNRVRHRLMPLLERDYAPGLTGRLVELAAEMRQVDDLLGTLAQDSARECLNQDGSLDVDRFKRLHPALASALMRRYVAAAVGNLQGIDRSHIEALCALARSGPPNGRIVLPYGWLSRRRYGKLLLLRSEKHNDVAPAFEVALAVEGLTVVESARTIFQSALVPHTLAPMPHDATEAVFDAHSLGGGLIARNFKPGDRISPFGLAGSRKVKDVFIEHKIPSDQRRRFPVVLLEGRVAWLPGLVRSSLALVTEETTEIVRLTATSKRCLQSNPRDTV
jgi:tRNA(Ile)-lysidine synthase